MKLNLLAKKAFLTKNAQYKIKQFMMTLIMDLKIPFFGYVRYLNDARYSVSCPVYPSVSVKT